MGSEEELTLAEKAEWFEGEKGIKFAMLAVAEQLQEQNRQLTRIADALYAKANNYSLADLVSALEDRLEL